MNHSLNLNGLIPKLPIIQGGMGVGISLHQLASSVALEGGIGILSSAQIGYRESDFLTHPLLANKRALTSELQKAKALSPKGIIGVNIMVALTHYKEMVQTAIDSGADLIISGAGLPITLRSIAKNRQIKLVPIVSSAKAAHILCKYWDQKDQVIPDGFIIEGPLAGGHLGFTYENLAQLANLPSVITLLEEIKKVIFPYEEKYHRKIPLIVAGGIYSGEEVASALSQGADGVQMATRFVTTYECDAPLAYKKAYLNANKKDIRIIKSPVGMLARALNNTLIEYPPGNQACLYHCLEKCSIDSIPYCISKALIATALGDTEHGLLFCGENVYRSKKLEHVHDIFTEITMALS